MKKYLIPTILLAVLLFASSCAQRGARGTVTETTGDHQPAQNTEQVRQEDQGTISDVLSSMNALPSLGYRGYNDYFWTAMLNNPIDQAFVEDDNHTNLKDTLSSYLERWKAEYAHSLALSEQFMQPDEYACFLEANRKWEEDMTDYYTIWSDIVFVDQRYGTSNIELSMLRVIDDYRQRTIDIKYLCFMKETNLDPEIYHPSGFDAEAEDPVLKSLTFCQISD